MSAFLNKILGDSDKYSLRHRIANAVILIGIFLSIQSAFFNYLLNLPDITVTATLATSFVLMISYYLSRIKGMFHLPVYLAVFTSLIIYTPVMWIGNGGSAGGFQYYIFIYATFVIAVIKNRKILIAIVSLILAIAILLIIYEYHYPEKIFEYPGRKDRMYDLIISFSSVFIGLSALFFVYTDHYRKTTEELLKRNEQLHIHNIEVEKHKNKIENQRRILENQNFHIKESIRYAKKIQNAVFSSYDIVKKNTKDSFILYLPKEKIGGDFYYFELKDDLLIIVIADSTGHGVPGGLMSMLGITMLEDIINLKDIKNAADILNFFREKIIISLDQESGNVVTNDGFDAAVCLIDTKKHTLNYAGANIPLILIRNNKITEFKANEMPVGTFINIEPFKDQTFELEENDSVYLFTDGIIDQFGGKHLKKFSQKRLTEILLKYSNESFFIQKEQVKKAFRKWKGSQKRTDDALIFGFKLY